MSEDRFPGNADPNRCNWGLGCAKPPTEAIEIHGHGETFMQGYCANHADQLTELVKAPLAAKKSHPA